jgi:outer membrane protein assembly factor BamA
VTTSVVYTTNQQTTFAVNNFLYFKENAWLLQGTFNYRIFPMFTWGVGGNTPDGWASRLENNGFLFDQMLLKSLGSNWFVGGGINVNYVYGQEDGNVGNAVNFIENNRSQKPEQFWNTIDQTLPFVVKDDMYPQSFAQDWSGQPSSFIQENYFRTPFQLYPFGTDETVFVLGLKLGLTYDSRDNINSPRTGTYFNFNYNLFLESLGNEKNFGTAKIDFRKYWMLQSFRDVVAVRSYMVFMTGDGPYINMPANNTDPNSTGTRGIPGFRYRGDNYIAAEVEYRKHLWKFLYGVAFVNAHSVSEKEQYLAAMDEPLRFDGKFRYVNPGYGLGANIVLDKA